ncbi:MAG: cupin domain-containing protein, partial [Nannocystaceae bacterium]
MSRVDPLSPAGAGSVLSAGVVRARLHEVADPAVRLRYLELAAGQRGRLEASEHWQLMLFGRGDARVLGRTIEPGELALLSPGSALGFEAGPRGFEWFEIEVLDPAEPGPGIGIAPRSPLVPFPEELIVVSETTPEYFGRTLSLAEVLVPPGVTTSQHRLSVDERYLMLEGTATMLLDGQALPTGPGDVIRIPAGVMQSIRNESPSEVLRFHCLCTPPFRRDAYTAGPVAGSGPEGFELEAWWQRAR